MGIDRKSTWIVDGDLNANFTSNPIATNGARAAQLQWNWAGTSTPNGTFYVQGSDDGTVYFDMKLAKVHVALGGTAVAAHTNDAAAITVNSSSAGRAHTTVEFPPAHMRLAYVSSSGGAVDTLQGRYRLIK